MESKKVIIVKEKDGQRIDAYISQTQKNVSRSMVQKLMQDEKILVNGKTVKTSYKVQFDDEIEITIPELQEISAKPEDIPLDILYEDDDIIVLNKEKGMVVHPANGNPDGTLVNAVLSHCKESLSGIGGMIRPGIIHRLDKDTSGAIIIAKNDQAHINISEQIKNREVVKKYIALVRGNILEQNATINMPIARSDKDRKKMAVDKSGKEAITHFEVLKRYEKYTLLDVKIDTGRTHQIRVHMAEIGHPVVGDFVYSNGKNEFNIQGQMLHAKSLEFIHPTTNEKMKIEAPLPKYFEDIIHKLV